MNTSNLLHNIVLLFSLAIRKLGELSENNIIQNFMCN